MRRGAVAVRRGQAIAGLVLAIASGCTEPLSTSGGSRLRSVLTGNAAAMLDASGQFVLPTGATSEGEISGDRAKVLAMAMWRDAAPFIRNTLERDRGGAIHVDLLEPCPRAYYVASAYSHVPANLTPLERKSLGPQWLVGLCYGETQEVVVGVSAFATDVDVAAESPYLRRSGVNNFFPMGVPVGSRIPFPPEEIAEIAAGAASRRIAKVPQLISRPRPWAPVVAVWRVEFESPFSVRANRGNHQTTELLVGPLNGWSRPAIGYALDGDFKEAEPDDLIYDNGTSSRTLRVKRQKGIPRSMELVTMEGR